MKINELLDTMNNNKNKILKPDQFQLALAKELEVKKYLSVKDKKELIDNIVNECILYSYGIFKFDDIEKYIVFTMKTIAAYTNLEMTDDIEADYDALCESGLLNNIIDLFVGEYENISMLLQMKCNYVLSSNSVESQIGRFLDNILEKVDMISSVMSEKVDKFDISKLPINKEDLTKLLSFINK